jgi:hypothetical protein
MNLITKDLFLAFLADHKVYIGEAYGKGKIMSENLGPNNTELYVYKWIIDEFGEDFIISILKDIQEYARNVDTMEKFYAKRKEMAHKLYDAYQTSEKGE